MRDFGRVIKYNGGVKQEAGILIDGKGWRNVPKGCRMLTPDLEGQVVEFEYEDLKGDGNFYVTELKTHDGRVRKIKDYLESFVDLVSKEMISDFMVFHRQLYSQFIPKKEAGEYNYSIAEREALVVKATIAVWSKYQEQKNRPVKKVFGEVNE